MTSLCCSSIPSLSTVSCKAERVLAQNTVQGAPLHQGHHSQLQTQTSADFVMLNGGFMLILIVAGPELDSWREPEDRSHLPLNDADCVVGAS